MGKRKNSLTGLITLLTDFGYSDTYVAQMKGVILCINPEARIVDITHSVAPGDVISASFLLGGAYKYFPAGSIHLTVVDPGVGTERKGIIVRTRDYYFVGPNNGVFTFPLLHEEVNKVVNIDIKRFSSVSRTFHGRDVFAPVAAGLSIGRTPEEYGNELDPAQLVKLDEDRPVKTRDRIYGKIIHVDNFGNLITNISEREISGSGLKVRVRGRTITGLSRTYMDVKSGELLAIINSFHLLEIAANGRSAQKILRAKRGDEVVVFIKR